MEEKTEEDIHGLIQTTMSDQIFVELLVAARNTVTLKWGEGIV